MPTDQLTTSTIRYVQIKEGYRVGDDGMVWSCVYPAGPGKRRFGEWKLLKPSPQYRGHMAVYLGRKDCRHVHRLVLEAFVGPCPEGMECRHLDGNPGNNVLSNLAWGTRKENILDRIQHDTSGQKLDSKDVARIRLLRESGVPASVLARVFDVSDIHIRQIARGISRPILSS